MATLLRNTWGSTIGSLSFDYSCQRLDDEGRLFTCIVKDRTDMVRLVSFDVSCDGMNCTWKDYPSYVG